MILNEDFKPVRSIFSKIYHASNLLIYHNDKNGISLFGDETRKQFLTNVKANWFWTEQITIDNSYILFEKGSRLKMLYQCTCLEIRVFEKQDGYTMSISGI